MTIAAETTVEDGQAPAVPVLGHIFVRVHDGAHVVAWSLGSTAVISGLTVDGMAAAARASAEFLGSLSDSEKRAVARAAGVTGLRICVHEWLLPLVQGRAADIEALMIEVVNAEGSIGPVA